MERYKSVNLMLPVCLSLAMLSGCSNLPGSRATQGTVAGGVGGAVIGNAVGGGTLGTVIGGVVGAGVGREAARRTR